MATIFTLLFFLSIMVLIVGMIKPSIFSRIIKTIPKRKTIALMCFGAIVISFIGIGVFTTPSENNIEQLSKQKSTEPVEVEIIAGQMETQDIETETNSQSDNSDLNNSTDQVVSDQAIQESKTETTLYLVTKVTDGDTFKVDINGTIETIRLIGVDTPESVDPRKPVECFGIEASNRAKELLSGKKVRLEADPTQGDRGIYGRLLRYVWLEDGTFFNKKIISDGYASEYTYNMPYKYQTEFKQAEKEARENKKGLWADGVCIQESEPVDQTSPTSQSTDKYYTSSYYSAKYYYPESCDGWKGLSEKYLKLYDSLNALLEVYPTKKLSPQCE